MQGGFLNQPRRKTLTELDEQWLEIQLWEITWIVDGAENFISFIRFEVSHGVHYC